MCPSFELGRAKELTGVYDSHSIHASYTLSTMVICVLVALLVAVAGGPMFRVKAWLRRGTTHDA